MNTTQSYPEFSIAIDLTRYIVFIDFFRRRGGVLSLWAHRWTPGVCDLDQKVLVCSVSFHLLQKSSL